MLNNSNPVIYNQMKRPFLLFLPFLLFIAGAFVACEEVEEAGKYDNWVPRNEAFIDSIKGKTGDNIVASQAKNAPAMNSKKGKNKRNGLFI
jgi:FKBP-type peptidyl-prolyl cis-trans isomerase FklB